MKGLVLTVAVFRGRVFERKEEERRGGQGPRGYLSKMAESEQLSSIGKRSWGKRGQCGVRRGLG